MNELDKRITDHLLFDFPRVITDAGIIMGARGVTGEVARTAAMLYKSGHFKHILVTGGLPTFQPDVWFMLKLSSFLRPLHIRNEDFLMRETNEHSASFYNLITSGISYSVISGEMDGTNTSENFNNLVGVINHLDIKSATIITPAYHQRRAIETCAKVFPNLTAFPHAVYPFGITRSSWPKTLVAGIVRGEFQKLNTANPKNYYAQGFCTPVHLDRLKERAKDFSLALK